MNKYVVTIGSNAIDEYYECPRYPLEGDKANIKPLDYEIGGMIPNAACIMSNYGIQTYLLDILGKDEYTDEILNNLKKYNVNIDYMEIRKTIKNSKTYIMLSENERTIFVVANPKPPIYIDDNRLELILNSQYVYTTMDDIKKIDNNKEIINLIKKSGAKLVFDVESSLFDDEAEYRFYFENADILFFNSSGFEKYRNGRDAEEVLDILVKATDKIVVLTLGERGCYVKTVKKSFKFEGIKVETKDTTGAGDTFNSTFIYGLMNNWNIRKTAMMANKAAALSTTTFGPKSGATSIENIINFK